MFDKIPDVGITSRGLRCHQEKEKGSLAEAREPSCANAGRLGLPPLPAEGRMLAKL